MFLSKTDVIKHEEDLKLLKVLLATSRKAIMRKWLDTTQPIFEDWQEVIWEIFIDIDISCENPKKTSLQNLE